ncbi:LysR family transcriptional regulator [Tumebacillus sp. ITR2]|uniref:LysR family transcriptional regulator n=1 Tax=Tumebacillus amylolyticus TaxID=2801339 RepID=A0ABS1JD04_9BACL|nr:LysR family transcriptional regulator [Tumebacillus amylolyticus]MBL0388085.1 LysR family transcriptional regulator [Tumebacillus amylolyticus]
MDDRDWLILKTLYEKKNITKTAQTLYTAQPTLTKRIQQMEREFNVTLVQRGTRGVQFTPEGEYLAKCADEMLDRLQQIKEHALNLNQEVMGTLRLGVSNYISKHKLPRLLKLFRERFPHVDFKVSTGWSRDVFQLVYNQDVHVGIVRGDYQWPDAKKLLFQEGICVASQNPIDLQDLPSHPRIEYEMDALMKSIIDNWWSRTFAHPPLIGMEVDKGDTCKEMVIHGLGYGILSSALIEHHPDLHRIEVTNDRGEPIVRDTWMFYHHTTLETKLVHEFVKFVESIDFTKDL